MSTEKTETQYESRRAHRTVYNEYAKIKDPKKREAYYTKHGAEVDAFKDARDYMINAYTRLQENLVAQFFMVM